MEYYNHEPYPPPLGPPQTFTSPSYQRSHGPVHYGVDMQGGAPMGHQYYSPSLQPMDQRYADPPVAPQRPAFGFQQNFDYSNQAFGSPSFSHAPLRSSHHIRGNFNNRMGGGRPFGPRTPKRPVPAPKTSPAVTQFYCELCKVTCAGQLCYDAHIVGQKHRKKAAQRDSLNKLNLELEAMGGKSATAGSHNELQCPICNVTCTGADAYRSHINGKNHQKIARLQKGLGKTASNPEMPLKTEGTPMPAAIEPKQQRIPASDDVEVKPILAENTDGFAEDCIVELKSGTTSAYCCRVCNCYFTDPNSKSNHLNGKKHHLTLKKALGINASGSKQSGSGRPHVQHLPAYVAPAWLPPRISKSGTNGAAFAQHTFVPTYSLGVFNHHPMAAGFGAQCGTPPHLLSDERYMQTKLRQIMPTQSESSLMKLAVTSCEAVLSRIGHSLQEREQEEENKKAELETSATETTEEVSTDQEAAEDESMDQEKRKKATLPPRRSPLRVFQGVFRVGPLATGLFLTGDRSAELVFVTPKWPTSDQIVDVSNELDVHLKESCKDFVVTVSSHPQEGHISVHISPGAAQRNVEEPAFISSEHQQQLVVVVRIRFTSVQVLGKIKSDEADEEEDAEEEEEEEEEKKVRLGEALSCKDGLSKTLCIAALTEVRRALWLQAALGGHPTSSNIVNVARLISSLVRDSTPKSWGNFPDYVLHVLLERISYLDAQAGAARMRPGILLRRLLEALSSGILLSELTNLADPSTIKETLPFFEASALPTSLLLADMSAGDREEVTCTAQHCLRLVVFRQIFKMLNVPRFIPEQRRNNAQKRKALKDEEEPESVNTNGSAPGAAKVRRTVDIKTEELVTEND